MEQNKELLLRYLCMALPYKVKVCLYEKETCILLGIDGCEVYLDVDSDSFRIESIKPYLRPLSSITDEEMDAYTNTGSFLHANGIPYNLFYTTEGLIFLLNNHFDIFGLIPKGLAIEVTEENNPYNIKEE